MNGALQHWTTALAMALATLVLPPAAAGGAAGIRSGIASFDGCHDQTSHVPVPMAGADDRVPDDYKPLANPDGTANLHVAIHRCQVTLGGTPLPGPVTWAAVGVDLDPSDGDGFVPDRTDHANAPASLGLGTEDDPLLADAYLLFMVTDSQRLAHWLRAGTGVAAYHVKGITHEYAIPELLGAADFRFVAPSPTPSAFTVTGTARAQHERPVYADVNYWQDTRTPDGMTWRVKIAFPSHAGHVAPADVTVDAEDGSEMAQIIGTPDGTGKDPFPFSVLIDHYDAEKNVSKLGGASAPGAGLAERTPVYVNETNCDGVQAFIRVPAENVRPLVPAEFQLATDVNGNALLQIGANRCERLAIGTGVGRTTTFATFRVGVCDPEDDPVDPCNPANEDPADVANAELFNLYMLWVATDNRDLVRFFRKQGGVTDEAAVWVEDLVFELDADGTLEFEAPSPTPSPFTMVAQLGAAGPPVTITGNHWAAVPKGRMKMPDRLDQLEGRFVSGTIVPQEGSEMDRLFCDDTDGSFSGDAVGATGESLGTFFPTGSFTAFVEDVDLSPTGEASCVG